MRASATIEATAVRLRPRPMFEAADLGVRLVQAHAGVLWRTALPVYVPLVVVCFALLALQPWAPFLALYIAKPWLDRTLLFVLARALFRQPCGFGDLWAARRSVWWQGLGWTLTQRRLSPWRSFTQPALQLEGLRGSALRKRRRQLRAGHQGAALAMTMAFALAEQTIFIGVPLLFVWLVPGGEMGRAFEWANGIGPTWMQALLFAGQALAVAFVEPFFVGAGFAMYLNRRVELEAWDVEQALRHAFAAR
jgi:hypothetical protein